jgi:fructose-bisphosphate aldolase, class I
MSTPAMHSTIGALLARGKGILAADESTPSIKKRFDSIALASTEQSRRDYREMLFTTPGLGEFISGVILFDETLRQKTKAGVLFTEVLATQGIVPGIKVDAGAVTLAGFPNEKITQGLDGLRERLREYAQLGARFAKWRAVIEIGPGLPTPGAIAANAQALAGYAALSQEAGLVPIVEPEVLMDGDHTLARCEEAIQATLTAVFEALRTNRVILEAMLLKSGMVLSGAECPQQAGDAEVAEATVRCFRRTVPAAVPGIVFLSGGQASVPATARLNAIAALGAQPWRLTFSYGRALQDPALKIWGGSAANVPEAQAALSHRARCNGLAVQATYSAQRENLS